MQAGSPYSFLALAGHVAQNTSLDSPTGFAICSTNYVWYNSLHQFNKRFEKEKVIGKHSYPMGTRRIRCPGFNIRTHIC
jgi:hypothetical protein